MFLASLATAAVLIWQCASAGAITTVEYRAGIAQGPAGDVSGIATGPDGNLWFTEHAGRLGRITPAGVVTELPDFLTRLIAISAGPDGAIWFTSAEGIGRMTVDGGSRAVFPLGPTAGTPFALVSGPDGALWFPMALGGGPTVGRITTAGAVTLFTPPYGPSQPQDMTNGPDGALWFTEEGLPIEPEHPSAGTTFRGIVRVTTAGTFTPFPLHAKNIHPFHLTTGPDGALWFTAPGTPARVGRLTTSGTYTLFDARVPRGHSIGPIVLGPDRNLWYAISGGLVGRMTRTGLTTIFRTASRDLAVGYLAAGPDGNVWMTAESGGIVKIEPPSGRCVVPRLVGLRFARAKRRLRRADCTVGAIAAPRRAHRGRLVVQHQFPRRGARLPAESAVDVMLRR